MELQAKVSGVPYIDQYLGVWSMYPPALQSFKTLAEQINVNVHLSSQPAEPVARHSDDIQYVTNSDGIALIELHGTLLKHSSSFSANTSTVEARRLVRAANKSSDVLGVMFHIDSPGGTVAGTDDLAKDIKSLQAVKPTMAFIEDLGASAAYWLAAQTGTVYSNATAVIGSIGVLSVVYDLSRVAEAENITVHVIKAGEMKGAGVPGTEITAEQLSEWQKLVDAFYADFIKAIEVGRSLSQARVRDLADGRVHIGKVAADLGLTDGVRGLDEAISELIALTQRGTTSTRRAEMSEKDVSVEDAAAKAATPAELKAALPSADRGFLFEQVEKSATLADAQTEYIQLQSEQMAALEAARADDEKKASAKKDDPPPARGQRPLADSGQPDAECDTFESAVDDLMVSKKLDRRIASRVAAKRFHELHEAFMDDCPAGRSKIDR